MSHQETLISVDIEASGSVPGEYSMLSLGACVVGDVSKNFYIELKPITRKYDAEALAVAHLDLDELEQNGIEPVTAMRDFEKWIANVTPLEHLPVFVAYPLAFDWMFVAYYFHRFLKRNPFGVSGIDVKSYYAGMTGKPFVLSSKQEMEPEYFADVPLTHNAREDAIVQAELFERLLNHSRRKL